MQGILRGFDPFMNLVVDDSLEMGPGGQQNSIGMVVSTLAYIDQYFPYCNKSPCNHSLFTMWCTTFMFTFFNMVQILSLITHSFTEINVE